MIKDSGNVNDCRQSSANSTVYIVPDIQLQGYELSLREVKGSFNGF